LLLFNFILLDNLNELEFSRKDSYHSEINEEGHRFNFLRATGYAGDLEYENNTGNEFNRTQNDFNSIRRIKENSQLMQFNLENNLAGIY
jgi:hypothetical protein